MDANMISLLNFTPGIILKQSGVVRQVIDPSDWVKLLTMQDPMMVVTASQWIRVCNGLYKGDPGFVTHVEAWGARVLVIPHLKTPTPQAAASLKESDQPSSQNQGSLTLLLSRCLCSNVRQNFITMESTPIPAPWRLLVYQRRRLQVRLRHQQNTSLLGNYLFYF